MTGANVELTYVGKGVVGTRGLHTVMVVFACGCHHGFRGVGVSVLDPVLREAGVTAAEQ